MIFPKGFPKYSPCEFRRFAEVYDLIKPTGLTINVEIKSGTTVYEGIEPKLVKLTEKCGMSEQDNSSTFSTLQPDAIEEVEPGARIGLLYNEALIDPHLYAQHIRADAIHPYYPTLMVPGTIEGCKRAGIMIHPWTVNDADAMRFLMNAGVDALITDVPKKALEILGR